LTPPPAAFARQHGGTAGHALIGGDPGVEIAHRDDHVIERVNHTTTRSQVSVAGTVREA